MADDFQGYGPSPAQLEQAAEQKARPLWAGMLGLTVGQYESGQFNPAEFANYARRAGFGAPTGPLPDQSEAIKQGKVVDVSADQIARGIYLDGKQTNQALWIHPQTGQWVTVDQLPRGPNGALQAIGQPDGNPYVNRRGEIELAHMPEPSKWIKMRDRFVKPILLPAAAIALGGTYLPGLLAGSGASGAAGAASTAGTTAAGTAAAAAPEIGAGLFAGGAEAAAAGLPAGSFLGGSGQALGVLGSGGTAVGAALPSFAVPAIGSSLAAAAPSIFDKVANSAGSTLSKIGSSIASQVTGQTTQQGGGAKPPEEQGFMSGLMSWLGSPTGQAVSQVGSAALQGATAQRASEQQAQAAQAAIDEQRRQFNALQAGLAPFQQAGAQALGGFAPYQQAGTQAFQQQQALAGLQGQAAQQQAISALEQSPLYQSLAKQGEEAILQRASATGGLRGGNVQAALAQFRPAMLQQLIDQQYQRLGGFAGTGLETTARLAGMGQSAAAMQGQGGMGMASNIGALLAQQGQAQAGGTLGTAQGIGQLFNIPSQIAGQERANAMYNQMQDLYKQQTEMYRRQAQGL
jgi:hypothetical protein